MFKHILVTTDGSEIAQLALPVTRDLAQCLGSQITVIYVLPDPIKYLSTTDGFVSGELYDNLLSELRDDGQKLLSEALHHLDLPNAQSRLIEAGQRDIADIIAEEAKSLGCDLVVMSTHGRSGLGHLLLGSVAERLIHIHTSKVPLLLVKPS